MTDVATIAVVWLPRAMFLPGNESSLQEIIDLAFSPCVAAALRRWIPHVGGLCSLFFSRVPIDVGSRREISAAAL
jgi:hypothetical protein